MNTDTRGDNILDGLRFPIVERLLRIAPPARQRLFAIACARLAGSIAELHWDKKSLPVMQQTFSAAELLLAGTDRQDSCIVEAYAPARALSRQLHAIYHQLQDRIMEDTEEGRCTWEEHQQAPALSQAMRRYVAAEAAEFTLHESPFEAAALNLEILFNSLRIDYDTLLALARHWLIERPDAVERDPVLPLFKRFPDE